MGARGRAARLIWTVLLPLVLGSAPAEAKEAADELVVIVHPSNKTARLSAPELEAVFTAVRRSWTGGGRNVVPLNLPAGSQARVRFDRAVLGLEPDEVGRFWVDQKIRGGARPPRQIESAALVLRLVAKLPGAIGYVPAAEVDKTVKIVARIRDGKVIDP
jgi:ABC-type phosphate transport system substrate-binding protein